MGRRVHKPDNPIPLSHGCASHRPYLDLQFFQGFENTGIGYSPCYAGAEDKCNNSFHRLRKPPGAIYMVSGFIMSGGFNTPLLAAGYVDFIHPPFFSVKQVAYNRYADVVSGHGIPDAVVPQPEKVGREPGQGDPEAPWIDLSGLSRLLKSPYRKR